MAKKVEERVVRSGDYLLNDEIPTASGGYIVERQAYTKTEKVTIVKTAKPSSALTETNKRLRAGRATIKGGSTTARSQKSTFTY